MLRKQKQQQSQQDETGRDKEGGGCGGNGFAQTEQEMDTSAEPRQGSSACSIAHVGGAARTVAVSMHR